MGTFTTSLSDTVDRQLLSLSPAGLRIEPSLRTKMQMLQWCGEGPEGVVED